MKKLEDFLKPTQKELFNLLRKKYRGGTVARKGSYILVPGKAPVMLLAHLDTVHEKPVKHICKSFDGNILMSPQGIGGDDRCGVYALVRAYEAAPIKPWLLFTCDEETGGVGADTFAEEHNKGKLPKGLDALKLLIEIDRKGSNDAVYYSCDNPDFEAYITSKGFVTANGSFSDISIIAPELGVAAVNLSSGYYNAHTLHEYINRKQIDAVIQSVLGIIADAVQPDFQKYRYIERVRSFMGFDSGYEAWGVYRPELNDWGRYDVANARKVPLSLKSQVEDDFALDDLPSDLIGMYDELLELYSDDELLELRQKFGNQIINRLYEEEFGPFFDTVDELANEDEYTEVDWLRKDEFATIDRIEKEDL